MAQRNIKGTNRVEVDNLEDLKPGTGVQIDNKTKYEYASELATEGVPLIDPGGGPVNVIRVFTFKMNPEKAKDFAPNKQILFNSHAQQIKHTLWGDGLRPLENVGPRVIIDSKRGFYQIFVTCEATKGVIFSERHRNPELLHKQLANGKLEPNRK